MYYAFDLDGTLVDTKELIIASYKRVGVTPPEDFFGKPWQEWLDDEEKHRQKNEVYIAMIPKHLKPLPLLSLFQRLIVDDGPGGIKYAPTILTAASQIAALAILQHLKLECAIYNLHAGLTLQMKINWMNLKSSQGEDGIMFEDNIHTVKAMRSNTRWTICNLG